MARVMSELSEEEQNQLVAEYAQLPHGDRGKWIDAQDVTRTSFYGRRTQVMGLQGSKRGTPGSKNKPANQPVNQPATTFADADEATRRRLIAEYDRLPKLEKAPWREARELSLKTAQYYRNKFAKTPPSKTSTALARHHELAIEDIPEVQARPLAQPLNGSSSTDIHLPTFDDALSVIKVRRDMYNQIYSDIINDLTRMKR